MKHTIYTPKHHLWYGIIIRGTNLSEIKWQLIFCKRGPLIKTYTQRTIKAPRFECIVWTAEVRIFVLHLKITRIYNWKLFVSTPFATESGWEPVYSIIVKVMHQGSAQIDNDWIVEGSGGVRPGCLTQVSVFANNIVHVNLTWRDRSDTHTHTTDQSSVI